MTEMLIALNTVESIAFCAFVAWYFTREYYIGRHR
jgi:hypothetical protein